MITLHYIDSIHYIDYINYINYIHYIGCIHYIPTYIPTYVPTYQHTYLHTYIHACVSCDFFISFCRSHTATIDLGAAPSQRPAWLRVFPMLAPQARIKNWFPTHYPPAPNWHTQTPFPCKIFCQFWKKNTKSKTQNNRSNIPRNAKQKIEYCFKPG